MVMCFPSGQNRGREFFFQKTACTLLMAEHEQVGLYPVQPLITLLSGPSMLYTSSVWGRPGLRTSYSCWTTGAKHRDGSRNLTLHRSGVNIDFQVLTYHHIAIIHQWCPSLSISVHRDGATVSRSRQKHTWPTNHESISGANHNASSCFQHQITSETKLTALNDRNRLWCALWLFFVWSMSHSLTRRRPGLRTIRQSATRGRSGH